MAAGQLFFDGISRAALVVMGSDETTGRTPVFKAQSYRTPGPRIDLEAFHDQRLTEVLRVIGVGERAGPPELALTLLALELYRDGAVAQFHLVQRDIGGVPRDAFGLPRFTVEAADDRGTAYTDRPHGGSGGGTDATGVVWRMAVALAPAVPADARELRLRIAEVVWSTLSGSEMVDSQRTPGPWEFRIRL